MSDEDRIGGEIYQYHLLTVEGAMTRRHWLAAAFATLLGWLGWKKPIQAHPICQMEVYNFHETLKEAIEKAVVQGIKPSGDFSDLNALQVARADTSKLDCIMDIAHALQDVFKRYTLTTRTRAWDALTSKDGENKVRSLIHTPTRSLSPFRTLVP